GDRVVQALQMRTNERETVTHSPRRMVDQWDEPRAVGVAAYGGCRDLVGYAGFAEGRRTHASPERTPIEGLAAGAQPLVHAPQPQVRHLAGCDGAVVGGEKAFEGRRARPVHSGDVQNVGHEAKPTPRRWRASSGAVAAVTIHLSRVPIVRRHSTSARIEKPPSNRIGLP